MFSGIDDRLPVIDMRFLFVLFLLDLDDTLPPPAAVM